MLENEAEHPSSSDALSDETVQLRQDNRRLQQKVAQLQNREAQLLQTLQVYKPQ